SRYATTVSAAVEFPLPESAPALPGGPLRGYHAVPPPHLRKEPPMTNKHSEFDSLVPGRPQDRPFSRRDFIATSAGVGFALATQPMMAQTALHTDSAGLVAGRVKVPSSLGEVDAYQARPAGQERLPVI